MAMALECEICRPHPAYVFFGCFARIGFELFGRVAERTHRLPKIEIFECEFEFEKLLKSQISERVRVGASGWENDAGANRVIRESE